jgi:hypothetical protein
MLRENHVPATKPCQQRDRLFCLRDFRCKVAQELGFDFLENFLNYSKAIYASRRIAHSLPCFDFRKTLEKTARSLEIRVALQKRALRGRNKFLRSAAQFFRGAAQTQKVLPRRAFGSPAAYELHSPILPNFRAAPDQQRSNLAGPIDVSSAARLEVSALDLNRAQNSRTLDLLPRPKFRQVLGSAVPHRHRPVFKNNRVGSAFRTFENFLRWLGAFQVNRAHVRPKMKGHRWPAKALLKHRRQQMLSRMLLHVIESPFPVEAARDIRASGAAVNYVHDFVAIIADIEYIRIPDFS